MPTWQNTRPTSWLRFQPVNVGGHKHSAHPLLSQSDWFWKEAQPWWILPGEEPEHSRKLYRRAGKWRHALMSKICFLSRLKSGESFDNAQFSWVSSHCLDISQQPVHKGARCSAPWLTFCLCSGLAGNLKHCFKGGFRGNGGLCPQQTFVPWWRGLFCRF